MLREKLQQVEERIQRAAARCGRRREDILLLAVTKKFPASHIREAFELGLRDFGENYVQEFEGKHAQVADLAGARFHLIGHLQSNKARRAAELFDCVQTVDTAKLARRLAEVKPLEVMIEVKLSPEQAKSGTPAAEVPELVEAIRAVPQLRLRGLMTMPPWSENAEDSRPYFAKLRELGQSCGTAGLSMGMSHDLEVAIEEGSTCVRIGTALFGPRPRGTP